MTGHESSHAHQSVNWEALAATRGTLVILMGAETIGNVALRLQRAGMPPETPAAAVRWATTERQEVVRATLETIGHASVEPPATIIIGALAAIDVRARQAELAAHAEPR